MASKSLSSSEILLSVRMFVRDALFEQLLIFSLINDDEKIS